MNRNRIWIALLLAAVMLFSGCAMQTVDQMYRLPKRSEDYDNLQSAIDQAMTGLQYSAPTAGENQQTVQMADLTGDGAEEYLLFARSSSESPLRVLVFTKNGDQVALLTTIECLGSGFEQVEYVDIDGQPGLELVVGRRVSDQVMGAVSVYTFARGEAENLMNCNYSKFLSCDLDSDGRSELMVLSAGEAEADQGVAVLYSFRAGQMERSPEVNLSHPASCIKRIMAGSLHGGVPAVYVASSPDGSSIVTDIFALKEDTFTNISFSNESGTSVRTLRNYYVYADDIDDDGILELPSLITMRTPTMTWSAEKQYLIRWFAMDLEGGEVDKMYTFHNYAGGWFLELSGNWATRVCVEQIDGAFVFSIWDGLNPEAVFRIYALTGDSREAVAVEMGCSVLYKGDTVLYAAKLEAASGAYGITEDNLINAFRLIQQDWRTGET